MDLIKLRYFMRIAELGSISYAAQEFGLAQPVVSRYVKELEEQIGLPVFYRNGRGVLLTEAGSLLFERGRALLDLANGIQAELETFRTSPSGTVLVGVPRTVSHLVAAPLARWFMKTLPSAHLTLIEAGSAEIREWLRTGRIDIGIIYDEKTTSAGSLPTECLWLVGSRGSLVANAPLSMEDVCKLPLILPRRPNGLRLVIDAAALKSSINLHPVLEIDTLEAVKELIADGSAYTILPHSAIRAEVQRGEFVLYEIAPAITRRLCIEISQQRPFFRAASDTMKYLDELCRKVFTNAG